jgi:hypothetical protein
VVDDQQSRHASDRGTDSSGPHLNEPAIRSDIQKFLLSYRLFDVTAAMSANAAPKVGAIVIFQQSR